MNPAKTLARIPTPLCYKETRNLTPNIKWNDPAFRFCRKFPIFTPTTSAHDRCLHLVPNSVRTVASDFSSAGVSQNREREKLDKLEENIEKVMVMKLLVMFVGKFMVFIQLFVAALLQVIYGCRFFAILAVWGSLIGSFLCFFKVRFLNSWLYLYVSPQILLLLYTPSCLSLYVNSMTFALNLYGFMLNTWWQSV